MNKNLTTDIHEWFDESLNAGRVRQLSEGIQLDAWYSYNTNEFIANVAGGGNSKVLILIKNYVYSVKQQFHYQERKTTYSTCTFKSHYGIPIFHFEKQTFASDV